MDINELALWLGLSKLKGISALDKKTWLQQFVSILNAHEAWQQNYPTKDWQPDLASAEQVTHWCMQRSDNHIISLFDSHYPIALKAIDDPPWLLYISGQIESLALPSIAIVGSRNASTVGLEIANQWAAELAQIGWIVTSGLALGIDAAAHRGALTSGQTIAVQGCGLNHCYPKRHQSLANSIQQQGVLISEFLPDVGIRRHHFPLRNRIVSGLSYGVIVIEAGFKSGSLITARLAAEQGREVFAAPGSVLDPNQCGCHWLIQQGAKLVTSPIDIMAELAPQIDWPDPQLIPKNSQLSLSQLQQPSLLHHVGFEMTAVDQIVVRSGLSIDIVMEQLTIMELNGWVVAVPGGYTRTGKG